MLIGNRKRVNLYDRSAESAGRILLGTGLVWRLPPPKCEEKDVSAVFQRMLAVEVFGVLPSIGQERSDYPFRTLLYESSSYKHMKKVHFEDPVPPTMKEACRVGPGSCPVLQVMLWNVLLIE